MNAPAAAATPSTKDRILDAAERLFGMHGFEATSLRNITAEAGVNLAAVNYHFQSKEALIRATIARRIAPVNQRRVAMLDAAEAAAGDGPLPIAAVIDAFVRPVIEMRCHGEQTIAPMIGRIFAEDREFVERFFQDHLAPIARRFTVAFTRALPQLPREELFWRAHFLIGAMAHTMSGAHLLEALSGGLCHVDDVEATVRRMITAFTAMFVAPHMEVDNAR
jgi:AcrR family transcriptional regulator